MSNFSFSYSVFKRLVLQTHKNQGLFGKGLDVAKIKISVIHKEENIVGKGENAGHQHFIFFQQCFQKDSSPEFLKSYKCLIKGLWPLILLMSNFFPVW